MPAIFKTDCHESFGNKCNRMASFDIFPEKHDALSLCDSDHFRINWCRVTHGTASARSRGCLQGRGTSRTGNYGGPPCTQTSKPSKPLNVVFLCKVIVHLSACLCQELVISCLWSTFLHTLSYSLTSPKHMSSHQFRSMQSISGIMRKVMSSKPRKLSHPKLLLIR